MSRLFLKISIGIRRFLLKCFMQVYKVHIVHGSKYLEGTFEHASYCHQVTLKSPLDLIIHIIHSLYIWYCSPWRLPTSKEAFVSAYIHTI